ncbi:hypothetical protein [Aquibacillus kalidii]|uniref:hypothetical protein n=1 Tax=Aquibacillus kalidii TaxID=2762597 RepID=UPI001648AAB0|nr:hypothetical protein [Aquibacillus kalidii]
MQNKAHNLILAGIILNITQWVVIFILLQNIFGYFDGYTIFNPNVTNGSMQSFRFIDWLMSMIYSGVPFNYLVFIAIVTCLLYLIPTAIFIILEVVAYFMIRKNDHSSWSTFILAMGIKNVLIDLSGIPFLVAGLLMFKENKTS